MIMITYSSNERSNGKLDEIKKELLEMKLDPWMDDPRDDSNDFGIAPGDLHRERIAQAILSADLVLALSSLTWWNSGYCKWEFEFAKRAGKRIVFFPVAYGNESGELMQKAHDTDCPVIEHLDQLGSIVQVGAELAGAHAELLRLWYLRHQRQPGMDLLNNPWSMEEKRFWEAPVAKRDIIKLSKDPVVANHAEIIISGSTMYDIVGLNPGSEIISLAGSITGYDAGRKRFWRFLRIFILGTIILLSVLAVYLRNLASEEEEKAKEEQLVQQSILLAEKSQEQENSYKKLDLAEQAWHSADTDNARNSLMLAEEESGQIQAFRIPQGKYIGATLTSDTNFLVVGEQNNLYIANLSNGKVEKSISLDFEISKRYIASSKNADHVAVVDENGKLVVVDTQTGSASEIAFDLATAFCVDNEERLWVSHGDGLISVAESPWNESPYVTFQTETDMPTSILVTNDGKQLVLLLDNGDMQIYDIQDDSLHLDAVIPMFTEEYEAVPMLGSEPSLDADALVQSGDNIAALRQRKVSFWERNGNHVVYDQQRLSIYGSLIIPASLGKTVITYQGATSFPKVYPEGSADPLSFMYRSSRAGGNILAGTAEGEILAIVQPDGLVQIVHIDHVPLLTGSPKGLIPVPTDRGLFTLFPDGKLYSADGNVELDIGTETLLGCNLSAGGYFFTVSRDGQIFAVDTQTFQVFQSDAPPVLPSSVYSGSNEDQLLVYNEKGYCIYHIENNTGLVLDRYTADIMALETKEIIISAAVDNEGNHIALATSLGRLLVLSTEDDTLVSEGTYIGTGYGENILYNDIGQLLVLSAGGRINLYDEKLTPVSMTVFDKSVMGVFSIHDSPLALVKFVNGEFAVIHSRDLFIQQEISVRNNSNMSFFAMDMEKGEFWLNLVTFTQDEEDPYVTKLYQFKL